MTCVGESNRSRGGLARSPEVAHHEQDSQASLPAGIVPQAEEFADLA